MQKDVTTLIDLYQGIYGPSISIANLDELAKDLSRAVGRTRPWTGKFLHSLIKGYSGFRVTKQLITALNILANRRNGIDEVQAQATENQVLTVYPLPENTVILGKAQRCSTPGCDVLFVPVHPRQKYHSKKCAKEARRLSRTSSPSSG